MEAPPILRLDILSFKQDSDAAAEVILSLFFVQALNHIIWRQETLGNVSYKVVVYY